MFQNLFPEKFNMIQSKLFILFSLFSIFISILSADAQDTPHISHTTIFGNSPEHAHTDIILYKYSDYITRTEEVIDTFFVDTSGNFSCTFPLKHTQEIFMYLGAYKCFLFAEPDSTHEILLPPPREKTLQDDINPYFKHENISLGVKNPYPNDLNLHIYKFNTIYERFLTKNFQVLLVLRDKSLVDKLERQLDSVFKDYSDPFFDTYSSFRIYTLRHMTYERDMNKTTKKYFINSKPDYYNPPYISLFQMLWQDYILNNHMKELGTDMKQSIIFGKSPTMFKERLDSYVSFRNDTLQELILLQSLYDCFKDPVTFPEQTVRQTLDSVILLTKIPEHITIAQSILSQQNSLQEHDSAPDFTLYTADSLPIKLSAYRGTHVYLGFCRSENLECIQNYKVLQKIQENTKGYLEIILVSYEEDFRTFNDFVKNNSENYNWTFVYGKNNSEIAKKYKVSAMPSFILIDPNGDIELLQAPHPIDNFQQKFAAVYKKWKAKKQKEYKEQQLQRQW